MVQGVVSCGHNHILRANRLLEDEHMCGLKQKKHSKHFEYEKESIFFQAFK